MMTMQVRSTRFAVGLLLIALLLGGCGQSIASFGLESVPVDSASVTQTLRYVEGIKEGPLYEVGLTLPEDWVGNFVTSTAGNTVYYQFVDESGRRYPIFSIEALSEEQFWQQQGSYPAQRVSLRNTPDTFFVYHVLEDAFHSGLPKADFQALAEQVPGVMSSFDIVN
jgi:hypothetical protein